MSASSHDPYGESICPEIRHGTSLDLYGEIIWPRTIMMGASERITSSR